MIVCPPVSSDGDEGVLRCRRSDLNTPRLANRRLVRSLIDVTTIANGDHHDEQNSVIDVVNDSIVANPESVTFTPPERP